MSEVEDKSVMEDKSLVEDKPSDDVVVKYSSYTEAQKRASKKYREKNKEKVLEQRKKYYEERKEKDAEFLEKKRAKAREYYLKKKEAKAAEEHIEDDKQVESSVVNVEEVVKPKRGRKKKVEIVEPVKADEPEPGQKDLTIEKKDEEEVKKEKPKRGRKKKDEEVKVEDVKVEEVKEEPKPKPKRGGGKKKLEAVVEEPNVISSVDDIAGLMKCIDDVIKEVRETSPEIEQTIKPEPVKEVKKAPRRKIQKDK